MADKKPILNPDGVSVRGCQFIYAPKGQAGEYAPLAANPYRGCGHGCAYCYVPRVTKQDRQEFDGGAMLRSSYMPGLRRDAKLYQQAGITEQVMLSFTSDPYHLGNTMPTRETLDVLTEHGMAFCTLTKGGTRAIERWREAHPGKELVMPDHADLVVWLMDELDKAGKCGSCGEPLSRDCPHCKHLWER